jgi:hypothetical protein
MKKGNPPTIKPSHKGRLHEALHVPADEKIPASKIETATHSKDPHMRQMANYAKNAAHWSKH